MIRTSYNRTSTYYKNGEPGVASEVPPSEVYNDDDQRQTENTTRQTILFGPLT